MENQTMVSVPVVKKIPTGVKIIAVLYYIGAAVSLVGAIALFVGLSFLFPGLGAVGGVIALAVAVLSFLIAKGLYKGRPWARIVVIIFSILGIIGGLFSFLNSESSPVLSIIINALIGGYLLFNKEAKEAFKKS